MDAVDGLRQQRSDAKLSNLRGAGAILNFPGASPVRNARAAKKKRGFRPGARFNITLASISYSHSSISCLGSRPYGNDRVVCGTILVICSIIRRKWFASGLDACTW